VTGGATIVLASPASVVALAGENVHLTLAVADANGSPVPNGTTISVTLVSGTASFGGATSVDTTTDAHGHADVVLQSQTAPQRIALSATCGDTTSPLVLDIALPSSARAPPAVVVGVATAGVGPVPGTIEAPDNAPDGTLSRRGAVSIYGSGSIAKDTTATVAYATANTLDQSNGGGAFVDNPNARPFAIYGDSSTRFDDTQSLGHLYARVQHGASSAMYGEFSAQAGTPDAAGGYSILVNGTQLHVQ
jgi:hypothetical protein